jgi:anti-sigma-K factor RskA
MDCSGFRARHLEYLDNTLDERTLVACERHRSECAACAALDTRVRRSLLLCHNVPDPLPVCDLTARVLASVREDRHRRAQRRDLWSRVAVWTSACTACVLATLPLWPVGSAQRPDAPAVASVAAPVVELRLVGEGRTTPSLAQRTVFTPVATGPMDSMPRPYVSTAGTGREGNLLFLTSFSP